MVKKKTKKNLPARRPARELAVQWRPPSADTHPVGVYLASVSPGSRRTLEQSLHRIASWFVTASFKDPGAADAWLFPWDRVRYQHVAALRAALIEAFAPSTANKMLSALRGVLKEVWRLGYVDAETYQRSVDVRQVKVDKAAPARGRALSMGQLSQLFRSCAEDKAYLDAALLAVLAGCGLRRAELVALKLSDYRDTEEGAVFRVRGKGRKVREVPLGREVQGALEAWLQKVRGDAQGPLFCPVRKDGVVLKIAPLTAQAVYARLQRRATRAGVESFSPHDLRRTHASELLDAGADVLSVANLLGHAQVDTTRKYDRRGERAKRKAIQLLHLPWRAFAVL